MGFDVHLQLMDRENYQGRILPAVDAFRDARDVQPLVELLREAARRLAQQPPAPEDEGILTPDTCAEFIEILEGREFYRPGGGNDLDGSSSTRPEDLDQLVDGMVGPGLVETLGLVWDRGVRPGQNLGRTALVQHLYQHSAWIREALTFERVVTSGALEVPIGQSSEWVARENVERLRDELARMPRPIDAEAAADFDNLRELVALMLSEPRFALVLTVG